MADAYETVYLYARICGSFSLMSIGERGALLAKEATLSSLWKRYFGEELPDRQEAWLIAELERRAIRSSMDDFMSKASKIAESDAFLGALTAKFEMLSVKSMLSLLAEGKPKPERLIFTNPLLEKALAGWPNPGAMFEGTRYSWVDELSLQDTGAAENRMDREYYRELWNQAMRLPARKLGAIPALILKDIRYQNLMWALRLRRFYNYTKESAAPLLVEIEGRDVTNLALDSFDLDIDNLSTFSSWPERRLLASQKDSRLDIPSLEAAILGELFSLVRRSLHLYPSGYTPLYCYFKMLETEVSIVLAVLEGIRLDAPVEDRVFLARALSGEIE